MEKFPTFFSRNFRKGFSDSLKQSAARALKSRVKLSEQKRRWKNGFWVTVLQRNGDNYERRTDLDCHIDSMKGLSSFINLRLNNGKVH